MTTGQVPDGHLPGQVLLLAEPHPPSCCTQGSANKDPVYLGQQDTHTGNPLENRVDFLEGGGGPSWGGLLTAGSPYPGKQPAAQGQALRSL